LSSRCCSRRARDTAWRQAGNGGTYSTRDAKTPTVKINCNSVRKKSNRATVQDAQHPAAQHVTRHSVNAIVQWRYPEKDVWPCGKAYGKGRRRWTRNNHANVQAERRNGSA
jgi:hypothetical protein